jgi:UDP-glucose 4-epimerase
MHEVLVPDIASEFDRRTLVEGMDAVVHLAGVAHRRESETGMRRVNVDATVKLAEAAAGSVRRFVFLSSVKVHGEDSGTGAYRETDEPLPEDAYGRSKLEAERALTSLAERRDLELALLRPPLVYGPGVKGNFLRLLRWVGSGFPLPFGSVHNRRTLLFVGNLVDAIVLSVEHPQARGPFVLGDEESVSTPELIRRLARALERPARLLSVPPLLLRAAGKLAGLHGEIRRLTGSLAIDASRARELLAWKPPYTLDEGLGETARWFAPRRVDS